MAVWLGLWFWASMAIDWAFEPPIIVREIILAAAGLGLAIAVYRFILRRAFVRLTDSHMAMVLERRFPEFGDSLLTTVALADRPAADTGFNSTMLADTRTCAEQRMCPPRPVGRSLRLPSRWSKNSVIALGLAASCPACSRGISGCARLVGRAEPDADRQDVAARPIWKSSASTRTAWPRLPPTSF